MNSHNKIQHIHYYKHMDNQKDISQHIFYLNQYINHHKMKNIYYFLYMGHSNRIAQYKIYHHCLLINYSLHNYPDNNTHYYINISIYFAQCN